VLKWGGVKRKESWAYSINASKVGEGSRTAPSPYVLPRGGKEKGGPEVQGLQTRDIKKKMRERERCLPPLCPQGPKRGRVATARQRSLKCRCGYAEKESRETFSRRCCLSRRERTASRRPPSGPCRRGGEGSEDFFLSTKTIQVMPVFGVAQERGGTVLPESLGRGKAAHCATFSERKFTRRSDGRS